jgi:hypothetical protein
MLGLLASIAIVGCGGTTSAVTVATTSPATTHPASATTPATAAGGFTVQPLGLTFDLPSTFHVVKDDSFAFLARSSDPPAVFSIDHDTSDVTAYSARAGESLSTVQLDGLPNVVVTHAAISGLPVGVVANELLVTNASRSFSVIMSARAADLPAMWQTFVGSLHVAPT